MNDRDRAVSEALNAADRITRYRHLRMWVVVLVIVTLVAFIGLGVRTVQLDTRLCDRAAANRDAAIRLAHEALDPLPVTGVSEELAQLRLEAAPLRAKKLARFLADYPRVEC